VTHGLTWAMLGTWHAMGWGWGDVTRGGDVMCLRGSYANGVTVHGQAGVADVMDKVAVFFLYRTILFIWPV
jgi:hypothetical protein